MEWKKLVSLVKGILTEDIKLVILNFLLLSLALIANITTQAFCVPTNWATVVLIITWLHNITYPLTRHYERLSILTGFLNGLSLCTFLYMVVFLEHTIILLIIVILLSSTCIFFIFVVGVLGYELYFSYLKNSRRGIKLGTLLALAALFIFMLYSFYELIIFFLFPVFAALAPFFFIAQILWFLLLKKEFIVAKMSFLLALSLCVWLGRYAGIEYKKAMEAIEKAESSHYETVEHTFMTEKIVGMHFKYHTRFCEYDGWRPPLHEPMLIVGLWLNGMNDPLEMELKERLELYKKLFPNEPYKMNCSCAMQESKTYHNDPLFK